MMQRERDLREGVVATCRALAAKGLAEGTAGNVSARFGDIMLVSPSAIPYEIMMPDMVAAMPIGGDGDWIGPKRPSTEWRFHMDLYREREDIAAVVHCHSREATALSIARMEIPACHYMIAAFGGPTIRCADYATFGTSELSAAILAAMTGRDGCLMANHGQVTVGPTLARALTLAIEMEELAGLYRASRELPGFSILPDEEIARVRAKFRDYLAS